MAGACLEAPPGAPADLCGSIDRPRDSRLGNVIDYDFDDDATPTEVVHDRSGNRLDGALEDAIIVAGGKHGQNLQWTGGSEAMIEVPRNPLLHLGTALTLEMWVWRDEIGVDHGLFSTYDPDLAAGTQEGDRMTAAVSTALTELDGEPHVDTPENSIQARLMHLVLTRSADGWRRLYLDGRVVAENLVAGDLSSWDVSQRITVGGPIVDVSPSCETGDAGFWRGELHRLAVYSRALSAAEVAGNYGAGPDIDSSALR